MTDENKLIEPLYGPYKDQRISVPKADADQAIAEGWARDPYAADPKPPKEFSEKERDEILAKADRAARKWRGEEPAKDMAAKPAAGYATRDIPARDIPATAAAKPDNAPKKK